MEVTAMRVSLKSVFTIIAAVAVAVLSGCHSGGGSGMKPGYSQRWQREPARRLFNSTSTHSMSVFRTFSPVWERAGIHALSPRFWIYRP
jgi:hypothetical protein